ncbi:MAG: hypothetical protein LBT59_17615 [Clostridiales bacterium]|jgi:hypothetical protein|nr:hypothetical protein [Clostridiales bacterium]
MNYEILFYGGLILAGFALAAGIATAAVLYFRWKRLSAKLDAEYGKNGR